MARKTTKRAKPNERQQQFYESLTGFHTPYDFSPQAGDAELIQEDHVEKVERTEEDEVRARMIRQGLILFGLLIVQVILFVVLINSTVNLG